LSLSSAAPQPGSEGNKALLFQRVDVRTHLRMSRCCLEGEKRQQKPVLPFGMRNLRPQFSQLCANKCEIWPAAAQPSWVPFDESARMIQQILNDIPVVAVNEFPISDLSP
jgi:hypothetical protein